MKAREAAVTALYTQDAPDVRQVILRSLEVFLKKELHNLAGGRLSQGA